MDTWKRDETTVEDSDLSDDATGEWHPPYGGGEDEGC